MLKNSSFCVFECSLSHQQICGTMAHWASLFIFFKRGSEYPWYFPLPLTFISLRAQEGP
jgi:hypothetical protein